LKNYFSIGVFAFLALAGCESTPEASGPAPMGGLIVPASQMPDFCRAQASRQFGPSLQNISTDDPVSGTEGTKINGGWTSTETGDTAGTFECRYGASGAFQGVVRTS
jgi:hypothetical protein